MSNPTEPSGIGGWLVLPTIGLIFTPLKLVVGLMVNYLPIFTQGNWDLLTTPGGEHYHGLWAPIIIFEITGTVLFLLGAFVLLFLLFSKNHLFPKLMIVYLAANAGFLAMDFFAAQLIPAIANNPDPQSSTDLVRTGISALIWIPYFLNSKRVKNTFVKSPAGSENPHA